MRAFVFCCLLLGLGYALYTQGFADKLMSSRGAKRFSLPEVGAWKEVTRQGNKPTQIQLAIVSGSRWRVEAKSLGSGRMLIAVFDGSQFSCSIRGPRAESLDPRGPLGLLLAGLRGQRSNGEQMIDQRVYSKFTVKDEKYGSSEVLVDKAEVFPLVLKVGGGEGAGVEITYSRCAIDVPAHESRIFDRRELSPLFGRLLTP